MLSLSVHVERYNFNEKKLMQESIEKLTFKKDINVFSLLSPFGKKSTPIHLNKPHIIQRCFDLPGN